MGVILNFFARCTIGRGFKWKSDFKMMAMANFGVYIYFKTKKIVENQIWLFLPTGVALIFPFALLESWFQDANFEYHKPYVLYILNFDLKGGTEFFQGATPVGKKSQILFSTIFLVFKYI